MKLNKDKWIDKHEYELICDFDNQEQFDNFNEFAEHQYTVYCDNYDDTQEDGWQ